MVNLFMIVLWWPHNDTLLIWTHRQPVGLREVTWGASSFKINHKVAIISFMITIGMMINKVDPTSLSTSEALAGTRIQTSEERASISRSLLGFFFFICRSLLGLITLINVLLVDNDSDHPWLVLKHNQKEPWIWLPRDFDVLRDHNLIKWMGANSYRTSHYPYAEEILDFADQNGIVIIGICLLASLWRCSFSTSDLRYIQSNPTFRFECSNQFYMKLGWSKMV